MILDASAAVELVVSTAEQVPDLIGIAEEVADVPEHFHIEALSAIRRGHLRAELTAPQALGAISEIGRIRVRRHRVLPLAAGVWTLRERLSAYDAAYLALAERLGAELLTADRALARVAHERGCPVHYCGPA